MTKKTVAILTSIFAGMVLFSGHVVALSNPTIHIATAYHKTGNRYNVVAKGAPGDSFDLYVNDQHPPTKATADKNGWATFNGVRLIGSGKISFTQILKNKKNSTYQQPVNFTEHFTITNQTVSFSYNNVQTHVAVAYSKGNGRYDIIVKNNPSETLELYVNDKSPTKTTVNYDDWATFHNVQLAGSDKISFTHVYSRKNGSTYQWPISVVEYVNSLYSSVIGFTFNKPALAPTPPPAAVTPPPAVPTTAQTPTCTNGTYVNSAGNTVCSPETSPTAPAGATAQCVDGTYSFSQSSRGTCSHHGGVAQWL